MPVAFKDYYGALGLERNATEPEIKTAFRGKARQYHPDANPNDPTAEEKFKDINEAYEVLSDPEKRRMYDRFGDDWQRYRDAGVDPDDMSYGRPRGRTVYSNPKANTSSNEDFEQWFTGNGANEGSWEWSENGGFSDGGGRFSDFFTLLFGSDGREARNNTRTSRPTRGNDLEVHADITLREAYAGTNRKLTVQTPETCKTCDGTGTARGTMCPTCNGTSQTNRSKTLEVRIPQGVRTGSRVRIAGQGGPGLNGGPNGDVYLLITVIADPRFSQDGRNLRTTANVPLYTALLGGEVVVETITGRVALRIPEGTQNGRVFRLTGKGMPASGKYPAGDLLVSIEVELPTNLTDEEKSKLLELQSMRQ